MEQSHIGQKTKNIQNANNAIDVKQSHANSQDVNNTTSHHDQKFEDTNEITRTHIGLKAKNPENAKNTDYCIGQKINDAETAKRHNLIVQLT